MKTKTSALVLTLLSILSTIPALAQDCRDIYYKASLQPLNNHVVPPSKGERVGAVVQGVGAAMFFVDVPSAFATFGLGSAIYFTSLGLHKRQIQQAQEIVQGAYYENKAIRTTVDFVNKKLQSSGYPAISQQEAMQVVREASDSFFFCNWIKKNGAGKDLYSLFTKKDIRNYLIGYFSASKELL